MLTVFQIACLLSLGILAIGALLNLSTSPHWFVRAWDFPRVQILVLVIVIAVLYFLACARGHGLGALCSFSILGLSIFLAVWHAIRILPYTVLASPQTKRCQSTDLNHSLRIVVSNAEKENQQHERWMQVIRAARPDVLVVLEPNQTWMNAIESLRGEFQHEIAYPQDNWYGMLLLSNLPVVDSELRFLVQSDIPSIDAAIRLRSGAEVRLVAVHPRPPEPIRDNDSKARDAELICYARMLSEETRPVIIGGDLNDVAWSATTRLFLKISGLLDPRRGRGFFNTFHAGHWWMRFPLDHLFHSQHFTLRKIARLENVGSDHFPMFLELQYEPNRQDEQESLGADK